MKVLHLTKYFPPTYGGIENQSKSICDYLCKKKINVSVLTFGFKTEIKLKKYKIFSVKPLFIFFSQPISLLYFFIAKKVIQQSDIIHFHYPNIMALFVCFLFSRQKKLIIHWHSNIVRQKYLNFLFKPIEKILLNRSDKIILTSINYSKNFEFYNLYKKKISIINCSSPDLSKEFNKSLKIKKEFRKLKNQNLNCKIIYSMGRLVEYKGFKYLIRASKLLDDNVKIVIAGSGVQLNNLKNEIKLNNLENKVFLLGKISHSNHLCYLKRCDIFCLPSISSNEAFGIALIEAMTFSKPLITTKIKNSGINFVNVNQHTGYKVPIKDFKSLANAILRCLNNKKQLHKMSENSKKRYLKYFTTEIMNKKFYNLYNKLNEI